MQNQQQENKEGTIKKSLDLSSVFTNNLPELFGQLKISLVISTYQAGKIIIVRRDEHKMNTHYRNFLRPMGVAVRPDRISIGSLRWVEHYQNMPGLIPRLENSERFDACYVPRSTIETGSIDIHEMAWGQNNELWAVNTRFSCLCTFDHENSFIPQWRPHFISSLAPQDRCHLNGLGMVNGFPRFVTALGKTDDPAGWRNNKRDGGILMDVAQNKIIAEGLSMPHSPRWYNNQLWMLESGRGSLVKFDIKTNKKTEVIRLPGFTRGMDFYGPLAFIGLSKVRETATFSDFPLLEELEERICGVYVVNLQTGKLAGFIRFEGDVAEIFAVQLLHNQTFPELLEKSSELLNSTYMIPAGSMNHVDKNFK